MPLLLGEEKKKEKKKKVGREGGKKETPGRFTSTLTFGTVASRCPRFAAFNTPATDFNKGERRGKKRKKKGGEKSRTGEKRMVPLPP